MLERRNLERMAKKVARAFRRPSLLVDHDGAKEKRPPEQLGIYGWYFRTIPPSVPTSGCVSVGGLFRKSKTLLYVGISDNLQRRILKCHFGGTPQNSTLRKKLTRLLDIDNKELSVWMNEEAFATWLTVGDGILPANLHKWQIGDVEKILIGEMLSLPLNAEHNAQHPFHETLSRIMRDERR